MEKSPEKTIFVVEDDENINGLISKALQDVGYHVKSFFTGIGLSDEIVKSPPRLIILDLLLPNMDGLEIMKEIRKMIDIPVIILTSKGKEIDRVIGLELGADDYIVKPFSVRELVSRVKAVLRRYIALDHAKKSRIIIGDFSFDPESKEAVFRGKTIELTKTETSLLEHFVNNQNKLLTKDYFIMNVWGYNTDIQTRTVDVHIGNLRKKLNRFEEIPFSLHTVHAIGYKLVIKE